MTGLNRMRREPMASRTVVSQPYLPSKPSTNGWKTPGSMGSEDGGLRVEDGSGAWPKAVAVKAAKATRTVKTAKRMDWYLGFFIFLSLSVGFDFRFLISALTLYKVP